MDKDSTVVRKVVGLWWDYGGTGRRNEVDGQRLFAVSIDFSSFFFHSVVARHLSFFLLSFNGGYCLLAFSTQGEAFIFVWVLHCDTYCTKTSRQ
jgi:hypothetical protein